MSGRNTSPELSQNLLFARRQPYEYKRQALTEPDWHRFPAYRNVSTAQWRDPNWQRTNSVTTVRQLAEVFGPHLPESLAASIQEDQERYATMGLRITPHVLNTINEVDLWADPIRRYVLPAAADREPIWHTHPMSERDSLHEKEMSVIDGLVWRYPTKVLVELVTSCPVNCGHCTRMDMVGPSTPSTTKRKLKTTFQERAAAIVSYVKSHPSIRDLVISGGDLSNLRPDLLETFISQILTIEHVRQIRLATKAIIALPQHFLDQRVLETMERIASKARSAGVDIAIHTHANHVESITPLVCEAVANLYEAGFRHIRNQGVLLNNVNATFTAILDLCFALIDEARITPYYFYVCDPIPASEHWRIPLWRAQAIDKQLTGYLPGFATPRIVCDIPYVGKRTVHQADEYDPIRGISYWRKNYWTTVESMIGNPMRNRFSYFDPVASLPNEGRRFWERKRRNLQFQRPA
jgi:lysine 2,3-aminomutase